jgi:hypothetical protein
MLLALGILEFADFQHGQSLGELVVIVKEPLPHDGVGPVKVIPAE